MGGEHVHWLTVLHAQCGHHGWALEARVHPQTGNFYLEGGRKVGERLHGLYFEPCGHAYARRALGALVCGIVLGAWHGDEVIPKTAV
ncbi:hypothetical protein D3C72_2028020 [compost metagenome]